MISASGGIAIIGGGIVGLAAARAVQRRFPQHPVTVLEKEETLAAHQTGHNSGVIHSGLYYRPGSSKARLCVHGAALLLRFCQEHGVAHNVCGKVVVAVDPAEVPRLDELERRGRANGLPGVERIGPERLRELEPHARGVAALHVPGTGIVDFPGVVNALARQLSEHGGQVHTGVEVTGATRSPEVLVLQTRSGPMPFHRVINCAGLHADRVARLLGAEPGIQVLPFRGEYYQLRPERESMVRALIYPVPNPVFPFLGVHFTRMVRGGVEAGPNAVLALKREGYGRADFDPRDLAEMSRYPGFHRMVGRYWRTGLGEMWRSWNKSAFVTALQRLLPELRAEDLVAAGSGVRAQAVRPDGTMEDDFVFLPHGPALHVLNAPSPAATASLAIGEEIAARAGEMLGLEAASAPV